MSPDPAGPGIGPGLRPAGQDQANSTTHVDSLDGVRAAAAGAILLYHVAMQTGAALHDGIAGALLSRLDVAVSIFFVLSGLLLYRPWAVAALHDEPSPRLGVYLLRRALRILPLYWIVVVVAVIGWSRDHASDPWTWLELLSLTQNYDTSAWWNGTGPPGLMQMWSLSVEAAFYLTLPLMALLLARMSRTGQHATARAKRQLIGLLGFVLASFAWTLVQFSSVGSGYMQMWLPRYWVYFAAGMALAVVTAWMKTAREDVRLLLARRWWVCWLVAAVAYAVAATPLTGGRYVSVLDLKTSLFEQILYAVAAVGLVAPAAVLPPGPGIVRRLLGNPVMGYIGRISYGIFLWQFIAIDTWYGLTDQKMWTGGLATNFVAVAGLTGLYAFVSYQLVEEPIRRRRDRLTDL
ncbi:acyltransferase family protein [Streptomyces sp. NPDC001820]|uniref:acyltransferase family protein n=1 Tax=Streptomyces sp. NPDC001820 TaxID=3364613 RepID=UPI0036A72504